MIALLRQKLLGPTSASPNKQFLVATKYDMFLAQKTRFCFYFLGGTFLLQIPRKKHTNWLLYSGACHARTGHPPEQLMCQLPVFHLLASANGPTETSVDQPEVGAFFVGEVRLIWAFKQLKPNPLCVAIFEVKSGSLSAWIKQKVVGSFFWSKHLTTSGCNKCRGSCHWQLFSQAVMVALKLITSGSTCREDLGQTGTLSV